MVGRFWFKCNNCDCKNFTSGGSANDMPMRPDDPEEWQNSIWFECFECGEIVFSVSVTRGGKVEISRNKLG